MLALSALPAARHAVVVTENTPHEWQPMLGPLLSSRRNDLET